MTSHHFIVMRCVCISQVCACNTGYKCSNGCQARPPLNTHARRHRPSYVNFGDCGPLRAEIGKLAVGRHHCPASLPRERSLSRYQSTLSRSHECLGTERVPQTRTCQSVGGGPPANSSVAAQSECWRADCRAVLCGGTAYAAAIVRAEGLVYALATRNRFACPCRSPSAREGVTPQPHLHQRRGVLGRCDTGPAQHVHRKRILVPHGPHNNYCGPRVPAWCLLRKQVLHCTEVLDKRELLAAETKRSP